MTQICKSGGPAAFSSIVPVTFPANYPYTIMDDDYQIIADTSVPNLINLPSSPLIGMTFQVKDGTGMAGANVLTINGNGNLIDGNSNFFIQTNYGFAGFLFNGTEWNVVNN